MSLTLYIRGNQEKRERSPALAISLAGHIAAFIGLMQAPQITLPIPERGKSEYKQAFEGKEDKLVWYRFKKDLPNVAALEKTKPSPLRAEIRARQQIVASPKNSTKRTQFIWSPAPELRVVTPLDAPNLLAIRVPPPPKPLKPFAKPPEIQKVETAKIELPAAPPELKARALEATTLAAPPKPMKRFIPPPRRVPMKVAEVAPAPEAPQILATAAQNNAASLNVNFKAPPRPFTAPPSAAPAAAKQIELPSVPAPNVLVANSRDLNLAIVGLNPSDKPLPPAPPASSPGQFSTGSEVRKEGADSAGDGKGLTLPDLFVRGNRETKPDLIAQAFAAPTSALTLRGASNIGGSSNARPAKEGDAPLPPLSHSGAIKVSGAPDPRFNGRDVYMMAIQMPNLTSYSGSWLMWYADRTAKEAGLAPVAPPVPHRKVDPKYIAAAQSDRIEGKVQLACVIGKDGHVSTIELVRGLDDRLNQSAEEALGKWEFSPAIRQGEPVEVDVLVEIPFRLAPTRRVTY
jgi:TonB family protein